MKRERREERNDGSSFDVVASIERRIHTIRGERVMLDADLAVLYGVETKALNRAVVRNADRFPLDFAFQLTAEEAASLRYQSGTSRSSHGGRRYLPHAFTEQGVAMLSSVLRSPRAVAVNVEIMRAFVRLRSLLTTHAELARKLQDLERKYDGQFRVVFEAIWQMMRSAAPERFPDRKQIGFRASEPLPP